MIRIYNKLSREEKSILVQRPQMSNEEIFPFIKQIFDEVKREGDKALKDFTQKFDGVVIDDVKVSQNEIQDAASFLPNDLKSSIQLAAGNIETFHRAQKKGTTQVETMPGVVCWQKDVPIDRVGLYIPGGTAPLFSTVLMLAIPAVIAGCKEIILCSPPQKEYQSIHPGILYTAELCGITKMYKVGGAHAIAAMTFGTESIPKVDKIFGPGNQYVTAAKQLSFQLGMAIDMPAGPSEVLVYADHTCRPAFVASDLLSQAEHGADSQVVFVTPDVGLANQIKLEVMTQLKSLPRKNIAEAALKNSFGMVIPSVEEAFEFINDYAPEHLIIASEYPEPYLISIRNAGSVFSGNYTPESAGDYASGTNHTLPTASAARSFSGVNVQSFMKTITFQHISQSGLQKLAKTITTMARAENLEAHARAVEIRLSSSNEKGL